MADHQRFHLVDAPQLVKHVLAALTAARDGDAVQLIYAFWEPTNALEHPVFAQHRAETRRLFEALAPAGIELTAASWPELWAQWARRGGPVASQVDRVRDRYAVPVSSTAPDRR